VYPRGGGGLCAFGGGGVGTAWQWGFARDGGQVVDLWEGFAGR
jgi:hypothetical protein